MNDDHGFMRWVYIGMAAVAGAITALSFQQWRTMTRGEITMTLFVGAAFAILAVPYLAADVFNLSGFTESLRAACFITYVGGTCSNWLLPMLIKRVKKFVAGDEEGAK